MSGVKLSVCACTQRSLKWMTLELKLHTQFTPETMYCQTPVFVILTACWYVISGWKTSRPRSGCVQSCRTHFHKLWGMLFSPSLTCMLTMGKIMTSSIGSTCWLKLLLAGVCLSQDDSVKALVMQNTCMMAQHDMNGDVLWKLMHLACGEWLADVCSVIMIWTACDCTPEPLAGKGCTAHVLWNYMVHLHNAHVMVEGTALWHMFCTALPSQLLRCARTGSPYNDDTAHISQPNHKPSASTLRAHQDSCHAVQ